MKNPAQRAARIRRHLSDGNLAAATSMWRAMPTQQREDVELALGEPLMRRLIGAIEREAARRQKKLKRAEADRATQIALQQARIEEEAAGLAAFAAHLDDVRARGGSAGRLFALAAGAPA